ncbi:STAS domain-containing protein [Streptomyces pinistramenti]|uniref:STAS domain-containing protein n=1 Tax=Streptomyces pinistramenti TaxID=2884812 RepID=UPI001D085640|nr:STAS domain-containing protein [Streptomyces pinistramenti]MCB5908128.1 STAS domain-containing protein [Streptomyces pinistramenti]
MVTSYGAGVLRLTVPAVGRVEPWEGEIPVGGGSRTEDGAWRSAVPAWKAGDSPFPSALRLVGLRSPGIPGRKVREAAMRERVGCATAVLRGADGRTRVAVSGEIDIVSAPQLRMALDEALAGTGHLVEVDFGDVRFCDCCGLSVLLRARRRAHEQGADLRLVNVASPLVRRLLDGTGTVEALLGPLSAGREECGPI